MGYKVTEIAVVHHTRSYGRSKYGLNRFMHGFFDFITVIFIIKFLKRPMHFFGLAGCSVATLGVGICLYLTMLWFMGEAIGHRPLLTLGVLAILTGFQLISTGLIAEMLTYYYAKPNNNNKIDTIFGEDL
jgi:ABC-type Mn2+/Zn2+ transport system permease subunit